MAVDLFSPAVLARVPAGFFGAVLGLGGLANGWRAASRVWGLPAVIADALALTAVAVWAVVAVLWGAKWLRAREAAKTEMLSPVTGGFGGLVPFATMVAGLAVAGTVPALGQAMMILGILGQIVFVPWFVGRLWTGGRPAEASTPILYLPAVGGSFLVGMCSGALGAADGAAIAFGIGLASWIGLEAVLLQRLLTGPTLPPPLRPTLGIHLAAPPVACLSYLAATEGAPGLPGAMLLGYGLLQSLVMIRLVRWTTASGFGAHWWAFSFGVAAMPLAALRLIERGIGGAIVPSVAPVLFLLANLIIAGLTVQSLRAILAGRYLPPAPGQGAPMQSQSQSQSQGAPAKG